MAGKLARKRGGFSPCGRQSHMGVDPNNDNARIQSIVNGIMTNNPGRPIPFNKVWTLIFFKYDVLIR